MAPKTKKETENSIAYTTPEGQKAQGDNSERRWSTPFLVTLGVLMLLAILIIGYQFYMQEQKTVPVVDTIDNSNYGGAQQPATSTTTTSEEAFREAELQQTMETAREFIPVENELILLRQEVRAYEERGEAVPQTLQADIAELEARLDEVRQQSDDRQQALYEQQMEQQAANGDRRNSAEMNN